jgi:hypothetical protein
MSSVDGIPKDTHLEVWMWSNKADGELWSWEKLFGWLVCVRGISLLSNALVFLSFFWAQRKVDVV